METQCCTMAANVGASVAEAD